MSYYEKLDVISEEDIEYYDIVKNGITTSMFFADEKEQAIKHYATLSRTENYEVYAINETKGIYAKLDWKEYVK